MKRYLAKHPQISLLRVVAVIVAFALGVAVGGVVERHRTLARSNDGPTLQPTSTNERALTSVWFGSRTASACPDVKKWAVAVVTAIYILPTKQDWNSKRVALLRLGFDEDAAYVSLIPRANPAGATELKFLRSAVSQWRATLKQSSSADAFQQSRKKRGDTRLTRDAHVLALTAKKCLPTRASERVG